MDLNRLMGLGGLMALMGLGGPCFSFLINSFRKMRALFNMSGPFSFSPLRRLVTFISGVLCHCMFVGEKKKLNHCKTIYQINPKSTPCIFSHLDLPLITDHKRLGVSDTWRVVMYPFAEDDDNHEWASKLIVKPQSLVSVVRVDSYYNPSLIPQLQVS